MATSTNSTNNYGPYKFVVSATNGNYTTLASAISAASSQDTIFIRDSVTEDVTISKNINIVATTDSNVGTSITGKITVSGAVTVGITGLSLITNSDYFLSATDSNACTITLTNCYLNASNNTGIQFTNSNSASVIDVDYCTYNISGATYAYHTMSSTGALNYNYCSLNNSGGSTTASSNSAGICSLWYCTADAVFSNSSTGITNFHYCDCNTGAVNATIFTCGGTGSPSIANHSQFYSGSASAISVSASATLTLNMCPINCSNTNQITGAGTLKYGLLEMQGSNSTINTTTQTATVSRFGQLVSNKQCAFLYYQGSSKTNATGTGTTYTLGSSVALTKVFDQTSSCTTGGTFTAPLTGRYYLSMGARVFNNTISNSVVVGILTSARGYYASTGRTGSSANQGAVVSAVCDMTAADTATFIVQSFGEASDTDTIYGDGNCNTFISGYQLC